MLLLGVVPSRSFYERLSMNPSSSAGEAHSSGCERQADTAEAGEFQRRAAKIDAQHRAENV